MILKWISYLGVGFMKLILKNINLIKINKYNNWRRKNSNISYFLFEKFMINYLLKKSSRFKIPDLKLLKKCLFLEEELECILETVSNTLFDFKFPFSN